MLGQAGTGTGTIDHARAEIARLLREGGVASPELDARLLVAHACGVARERIIVEGRTQMAPDSLAWAREAARRRVDGEPVHRILGYRDFMGRRFEFGPGVLEPRPETELLVERILRDHPPQRAVTRFAEVGSGSGVISVSLLCALPAARAAATDVQPEAIRWSASNARMHGVSDRLDLRLASCLDGIDGEHDFIVSNPPYIRSGDIAGLSREVREHDPVAALDGGEDGLTVFRQLLDQSRSRLRSGGRLYLETGHGQHDAIAGLARENGWGIVDRVLDFSGLERIVVLAPGDMNGRPA